MIVKSAQQHVIYINIVLVYISVGSSTGGASTRPAAGGSSSSGGAGSPSGSGSTARPAGGSGSASGSNVGGSGSARPSSSGVVAGGSSVQFANQPNRVAALMQDDQTSVTNIDRFESSNDGVQGSNNQQAIEPQPVNRPLGVVVARRPLGLLPFRRPIQYQLVNRDGAR